MENKSVFNCFLNCVMLLLSRMFLGSLFHRVGPAQANARRPKRSRLTLGTSSSNPPAERSERGGVWRRSSAARYSGVPLYMALCTSTSSLKSIRFLTGNQYMEYRSDLVHVSLIFSAIVVTTDLSASPTGAIVEGRDTGTTRNILYQGAWYCASGAGRSMTRLSRAATSLVNRSCLSPQRFSKCCLNVISLPLSTVVHCLTCVGSYCLSAYTHSNITDSLA